MGANCSLPHSPSITSRDPNSPAVASELFFFGLDFVFSLRFLPARANKRGMTLPEVVGSQRSERFYLFFKFIKN